MQSCTECFQKYNEGQIKLWTKEHIAFNKEPFICPFCWDLLHEGWTIPEDGIHVILPEVEE